MRKSLGILFCSFLLAVFLIPPGAGAASPALDPKIHAFFKEGIAKAFNMDEKGSESVILQGMGLDRDCPLGDSLLAMTNLFFHEMSFSEKERQERKDGMVRYATAAMTKGESRLGKNPQDGQAYFAMSLAKMTLIRLYIMEKRYWAIAQETGNIWNYLEKARSADPKNYDVYFARGVLHYHLDQLPAVTRFLSSLWVTSGDRKKGLEELEEAAKKGDLLKDLAKSELVSLYLNYEKKPELALPYARELRDQYRQNYNFTFALASVYGDLKRSDDALLLVEEIAKGIQSGAPPYRPELWSRYNLHMGRIFFEKGDFGKAEEFFQKVLSDSSLYNARNRAWAYVRLGMIADARKDRSKAEESYQKALDMEGAEGSAQVAARQYLKTPFARSP